MSKVIKARDLAIGGNPFIITDGASPDIRPVGEGLGEDELAAALEDELTREGREDGSESGSPGLEEYEETEFEEEIGPLGDAKRAAARLLREVRDKARALEESASLETAAIREQARAEGYAEGLERGRVEGREEGLAATRASMAEAAERATRFLEECQDARTRIMAASRDEVLKIVKKCAEKIVRSSVSLDGDVVQRAIGAALELVAEKSRLLIRVNPADVAKAREAEPHFLQFLPSSTQLEVLGDGAVQPGGCFIESAAGSVDARVETQLDEILLQLEGAVHAG